MHVSFEKPDHIDDVIDVIVEIEGAALDGHHARIDPIGEVDFMGRKQALDRAAQQCCVMAGQRRHDQHARRIRDVRFGKIAAEMNEPAEWLVPDHALMHGNVAPADARGGDAEFGFGVAARRPLQKLRRRSRSPAYGRVGERIEWVAEEEFGRTRSHARRVHRRMSKFIKMIEHASPPRLRQISLNASTRQNRIGGANTALQQKCDGNPVRRDQLNQKV